MPIWSHKLTILAPGIHPDVSEDLLYSLDKTLSEIDAYDIKLMLDEATNEKVVRFFGTKKEDVDSIESFALKHNNYGFRHLFADTKFDVFIGDITYDSGEVLCIEEYDSPTFENYVSLGFETKSYFNVKFKNDDDFKNIINDPNSSEMLVTEAAKYLMEIKYCSVNHDLTHGLIYHRNFPIEEQLRLMGEV